MKLKQQLVSLAAKHGWTSNLTVLPTSVNLSKGEKRLWNAGRKWICADLTGNGSSVSIQYRNHREYATLGEALKTEG